jgi:hypothetical protein
MGSMPGRSPAWSARLDFRRRAAAKLLTKDEAADCGELRQAAELLCPKRATAVDRPAPPPSDISVRWNSKNRRS